MYIFFFFSRTIGKRSVSYLILLCGFLDLMRIISATHRVRIDLLVYTVFTICFVLYRSSISILCKVSTPIRKRDRRILSLIHRPRYATMRETRNEQSESVIFLVDDSPLSVVERLHRLRLPPGSVYLNDFSHTRHRAPIANECCVDIEFPSVGLSLNYLRLTFPRPVSSARLQPRSLLAFPRVEFHPSPLAFPSFSSPSPSSLPH